MRPSARPRQSSLAPDGLRWSGVPPKIETRASNSLPLPCRARRLTGTRQAAARVLLRIDAASKQKAFDHGRLGDEAAASWCEYARVPAVGGRLPFALGGVEVAP